MKNNSTYKPKPLPKPEEDREWDKLYIEKLQKELEYDPYAIFRKNQFISRETE